MSNDVRHIDKSKYTPEHMVNYFRYCPHCGSEHFEPQTRKEMKCQACGFDFFPNSAAAIACVIVDRDGKIMLTRRARNPWKGMLDLPGGFVDPCESAEDAVCRELSEELGVKVRQMRYFVSFPNKYIYSNYEVNTTDMGFECIVEKLDGIEAHDDIDGIEWYGALEIPWDEIPAPSIRNIIETYIKTR